MKKSCIYSLFIYCITLGLLISIGEFSFAYGQTCEGLAAGNHHTCVLTSETLSPLPDVKANGSDLPISVILGTPFTLTGHLNANSLSGQNADWWAGVEITNSPLCKLDPNSLYCVWYHYDLSLGWMPGLTTTAQVPLYDTDTYDVLSMSWLPIGTYTYYFGVDMVMNGLLDLDQIYYDSVEVNINPLPGTPSLSLIPSTLPAGTKYTYYSQNVTMIVQDGSPPYTYSCSGSGVAGITATINSNTCIISGTPSGTGTYSVTYRVDDNDGNYDVENGSFTVSAPWYPGDPPGVVEVYNHDTLNREPISPGGTNYYKFTVTPSQSGMQVSLSTFDWVTNQDMMISLGSPYPTTADYPPSSSFNANGQFINGSQKWAKIISGSSNETLYVYNLSAGTYYVIIHNTSSIEGSYGFSLIAW